MAFFNSAVGVLLLAILRLLVKIGMEVSSFILGALMLIVFGCIIFTIVQHPWLKEELSKVNDKFKMLNTPMDSIRALPYMRHFRENGLSRTKTIGRGDECCNFLLQYRDWPGMIHTEFISNFSNTSLIYSGNGI